MAVAGLAVPDTELAAVTAEILALKEAVNYPHEVKWAKASKRRVNVHREMLELFARLLEADRIQFHIRFAPFDEYDHKLSGPNKRADTVSKMFFQLLLHRAVRFYGPHFKIHIRPDKGDCTSALMGQVDNLHSHAWGKYDCPMDCIASVECMDSKREPILQLLDVPLGALAAIRNGRHTDERLGPIKRELAEFMLARLPQIDVHRDNGPKAFKVSVWNVRPKGAKARGPWS